MLVLLILSGLTTAQTGKQDTVPCMIRDQMQLIKEAAYMDTAFWQELKFLLIEELELDTTLTPDTL